MRELISSGTDLVRSARVVALYRIVRFDSVAILSGARVRAPSNPAPPLSILSYFSRGESKIEWRRGALIQHFRARRQSRRAYLPENAIDRTFSSCRVRGIIVLIASAIVFSQLNIESSLNRRAICGMVKEVQ